MVGVALVFAMGGKVAAEVVSVQAAKDNTLYEHAAGALSNGAGAHLFAGRSGTNTGAIGPRRRALVFFDVSQAVPAGATIDGVTLSLHVSRAAGGTPAFVTLHRLTADWGEGTSNAPANEGAGTGSAPGDATWLHRFFPDVSWSMPTVNEAATILAIIQMLLYGGP